MSKTTLGVLCALVLSLPATAAVAQPDDEEEDLEANDQDDEETDSDDADDDDDDDDGDGDGAPKTPDQKAPGGSSGTTATSGGASEPEAPAPAARKVKAGKKGDVRLGGRVFLRDTITKLSADGAELQNEFGLESIRANIDLRKYGWLRASIEVSLEDSGDIDLEDVYAEIKLAPTLRVQAGRFKRPISPIALESAWKLPMTERGLLSDNVLVGDLTVPLNLGGRSEGAMINYRGRQGVRPRLYLGLFNARLPRRGGGGPEIAELADNLLRDVYARGELQLIKGFEVGGSFAVITRARNAGRLQSKYMGSVDLTIRTSAFRAWLEGFAGNTTLFDGVESVGTLLALRVLITPRFDKPVDHVRRIEPFVIFSALDPTDASDNNRAVEIGGGAAIWFSKLLRLQTDFTYNAYEDQFPTSTFSFIDRSTVRIQLGTQFR